MRPIDILLILLILYGMNNKEKLTDFGRFLRQFRTDKGLTGKEFAKKVNKGQSYISGIENGKTPLTYNFIMDYMNAFASTEEEKFNFLLRALHNTDKITIPLHDSRIVPKEQFLYVLSCYLLNSYLPDRYNCVKERQAILTLQGYITIKQEKD